MTPEQQKLIDAAAEAYEAALVKDAANPYIPALEAAVTVALKAAVDECRKWEESCRNNVWVFSPPMKGANTEAKLLHEGGEQTAAALTSAISSLIPAQEKTDV
jgi:hypothetical protein